jgi:serine-type D-Ala-D-Ala carboxypeptidase/endopeptidase (penicillin-binding protein 4)
MPAGERRLLVSRFSSGVYAGFMVTWVLAGFAPNPISAQTHRPQSKSCCDSRTPDGIAANRFSARTDVLLGAPPANKGEWGLLIADAETGKVLYEKNADDYFVPASNMKLFTTALALAKLGPDYRFRTTLETHGTLSADGKLSGDLYLVGRGDPNLSNRKFPYEGKEEFDGAPEKVLAELAASLAAKGVKEVKGDVIGDDSYFPREAYPDGWEIGDMVWEYGAAISAIVVDDNTVQLTLTPGARLSEPVQATLEPATPDFAVQNDAVTSAADVKSDLTLSREPGSKLVIVRGTLPAGSTPRKLTLALHEPAEHAAMLLIRQLAAAGIKVDGTSHAMHLPDIDSTVPRSVLAEHVSIPLGQSVKLVNKISQNLHTEMLLRATVRQVGMWNTPDDLAKFPADFYAVAGIAPGDVVQTDGSGLSRHDLVTPRALVAVLHYARTQPWFQPYYDSLPIAGVDGTLQDRMKNTVAAGRIHAKTGSVEHVRTRSGYAETPGGRRLIFAFLGNNQGGKNHEAGDALDGLCVAMLEEFERKPQHHAAKHTD